LVDICLNAYKNLLIFYQTFQPNDTIWCQCILILVTGEPTYSSIEAVRLWQCKSFGTIHKFWYYLTSYETSHIWSMPSKVLNYIFWCW
jgi:hypothetical protein